jgi:hypothetical protein
MKRLLVVALGLVAACSSSSGPSNPPPDSGTPDAGSLGALEITISAPDGGAPAVLVTGPGGFQQTVSATTTLGGLTPGSYALTAPVLRVPGTVVATEAEAPVPAAIDVAANQTAQASVTYTLRIGSGALWMGDTALSLFESYSDADLVAAGDRPFHGYVNAGTSSITGLAFDATGNLWVSESNQIVEIARADLGKPDAPTPVVTFTISTAPYPAGIAFDASGNLWVANYQLAQNGGAIVRLGRAQLGATGSQTVTPEASLTNIDDPSQLAFSADGSLLATGHASSRVMRFSPAQLAVTGTANTTPALTIQNASTCNTPCPFTPYWIAVDASGNAWIGDPAGFVNYLYGYSAALLSATGVQQVDPDLGFSSASISSPGGLAFDEAGDLWVSSTATNDVQRYLASEIAGTGFPTLTPAATIHSSASSTMSVGPLAFNPPAAALPIRR